MYWLKDIRTVNNVSFNVYEYFTVVDKVMCIATVEFETKEAFLDHLKTDCPFKLQTTHKDFIDGDIGFESIDDIKLWSDGDDEYPDTDCTDDTNN